MGNKSKPRKEMRRWWCCQLTNKNTNNNKNNQFTTMLKTRTTRTKIIHVSTEYVQFGMQNK
jgi:hypothetical protein